MPAYIKQIAIIAAIHLFFPINIHAMKARTKKKETPANVTITIYNYCDGHIYINTEQGRCLEKGAKDTIYGASKVIITRKDGSLVGVLSGKLLKKISSIALIRYYQSGHYSIELNNSTPSHALLE